MGRGAADGELVNRVRETRLSRGLSQRQLAERAGITRQAVNAVELSRYTPNAAVALRLARAMDSRVEDLFSLPISRRDDPVLTSGESMEVGDRVALARIGDVLVAHPLTGTRAIIEGFQPADALAGADGASVSMLAPPDAPARTAILLGCDPSLTVLTSWVARRLPEARLLWLHASSQSALDALPRGLAHIAGSHLPGDAEANVAPARRAVGREGGIVVTYAAWEQGLMIAPGNPKELRKAGDLAHQSVRIVNRESGSGSRKLLDELMAREGLAARDVAGYSSVVPSHTAVARAVAAGTADAGMGLEAVSRSFGLDFVPLVEVRFDLVVPQRHAAHPVIQAMLEVLQGARLRRDLAALPGYSTSQTGNVVASIKAA